jgi:hypothetical protein
LWPCEVVSVLDDELDVHWKSLLSTNIVLEVRQEEIKLLLRRTLVVVHAAALEEVAYQTNAEVVVRLIQWVVQARSGVATFPAVVEELVQGIED